MMIKDMVIHPCSLVIVLIAVLGHVVLADDTEQDLVRRLMQNYDKRIRPSKNSSEALNVTFGLALAQIIDVDEKNQIITTNCWLNQAWIDHKLKWNPKDYNDIKVVRLPHDSIWKPDILLYNNADVSSYASSVSTNMIVSHDGNVTWLSMIIFKSSCAIDVKYFPFDEQLCSMLFASWSYDGFQVNLNKVGKDGDVSNYIPNSEWTLVKLHAERHVVRYSCCEEPYPDVTYTIQIRRKPLFYVFNMILPCCIITLVALLGFYIPSDSGEKVTMGITTLLSMTVFLMLVAESMPPTSDVLPLIGHIMMSSFVARGNQFIQLVKVLYCKLLTNGKKIPTFPHMVQGLDCRPQRWETRVLVCRGLYYGITICIVSFATAMTVLTLNIHHKGLRGTEVPALVKKICFGYLAKVLCLSLETTTPLETTGLKVDSDKTSTNQSSHNNSTYMKLHPVNCQKKSSFSGFSSRFGGHSHGQNTVLDYIPSTDLGNHSLSDNYEKYEMQDRHHTENGGMASHFSRLRHTGTGSSASTIPSSSESNFERQFVKTLQQVCQTIEKNEIRLADQDRRDYIKMEWQQVALVVDRVLLILFIIGTMGVSFGIILNAPHSLGFFVGEKVIGIGEGDPVEGE